MISPLSSASPAPTRSSADTVPSPQRHSGSAAAAVESTVVNLSQPGSSLKTVLDYLPADANQDGAVGELERRAFALRQQTTAVKTYEAVAAKASTKTPNPE